MKVFLSWSGETSQKVAIALRDWLPNVFQSLEPWLSSEDITKGARWSHDIAKALKESEIGIICVTRDNLDSRWLNFEAGALSKEFNVCVYLFGVEPSSLGGPLSMFQHTKANKEDTFRLLQSFNDKDTQVKLSDERLRKIFEVWWPELEARLNEISIAKPVSDKESSKSTSSEDKIDEVLSILKRMVNLQGDKNQSSEERHARPISKRDKINRPRLFIGSSTEGLPIAEVIQLGLDEVAECTLWTQGAFNLSQTTIESIVDATAKFDFAVLVLTPDDLTIKRGEIQASARDNILFELGLFTGALGRARTFMVFPRDSQPSFPSDLAGVTAATYSEREDGNLEAALGPVCTRIKKAMGVAKIVTMRQALRDLGGDEEGIQES
jgi:predicted nucleotide-binding protein